MQDKSIETPAERDAETDSAILGLLLYDHAGLWSVDEIEREIGDRIAVADSVARLYGAGLVHRLDGNQFAFASRAARATQPLDS